jgi:hypothetical protein
MAKNEALFRKVNEEVRDLNRRSFVAELDDQIQVICECSAQECIDQIDISLREYENARATPTTFVLRPGHESLEIETVVRRNARYVIVRKTGDAKRISEALDERN